MILKQRARLAYDSCKIFSVACDENIFTWNHKDDVLNLRRFAVFFGEPVM